jgi:hypothetical protein
MILSVHDKTGCQQVQGAIDGLLSHRKGTPQVIRRIFDALKDFTVGDDVWNHVAGGRSHCQSRFLGRVRVFPDKGIDTGGSKG